jgi:hypothetical protein
MKHHPLTCLLMTHDLTCTLGELERASKRYLSTPNRWLASFAPAAPTTDLAVAAIAFTIQLAIEAGHDPTKLRDLERDLITSLRPEIASELETTQG